MLQDILSCKSTDDNSVNTLLDRLPEMLIKGYGQVAKDSIASFIANSKKLQASTKFIAQAKTVSYKADTTTYTTWLVTVFKGARNKTDSIDLLCNWIANRMILGEDTVDYSALTPENFYNRIRDGKAFGEANRYSLFLGKMANYNQKQWGWGNVVIMNCEPDKQLVAQAGKQPQHTWVGFADDTGFVWCLADPFIGGVVRDKTTGNALSLDTVTAWLHNREKAGNVHVNTVKVSLQATGPCVFSPMLRSSKNLEYYKRDALSLGVTRGEWYTFLEEGSMTGTLVGSYWKAGGYPLATAYNVYTQTVKGVMFTTGLEEVLYDRYKFKVELAKVR